jgi:hypothetical protein
MGIFNHSSGEMDPIEPLLTTFGVGTYPIGEHRYGMRGVVRGIYRVEVVPRYNGDTSPSNQIYWALHNSPNSAFDRVLSSGDHTPFLLPVANAKFLTVRSSGGIFRLAEAY